MALKRLSGGAIVCCVLLGLSAWAQDPSEIPNQDGLILLEGFGLLYGKGLEDSAVNEFAGLSFDFGFLIGRDLELVTTPDGTPVGGYVLDGFGGQFEFGAARSPVDLSQGAPIPFFGWDIVRDLEIAPDWRTASQDAQIYQGYLLLDGLGGVHPVGNVNLPQYPLGPGGAMIASPYPETLLTNETPTAVVKGNPIDETSIARPIFTYFNWDIARDLEVSTDFVTITSQLVVSPEFTPASAAAGLSPRFATVSTTPGGQIIGMCNGYYILDGWGAVHSCRLPLEFDVNDDGIVNEFDLYEHDGLGQPVLDETGAPKPNPFFGKPANNRPLAPPWYGSRRLPFFGFDIARDIELTPSGNGFYLLDGFGMVHAVGDAHSAFQPPTPYFGFDIARGLILVPNTAGTGVLGYLVLDGFGQVHKAGLAEDYDISFTGKDGGPILSFMDSFRDIEITPGFAITTAPALQPGYVISVAPPDADLEDPNLIYSPDVSHTVVPTFQVSTAPYPFFDYVTGL